MHLINVIAFSFALITSSLWTIMLARLKWHYPAQRYAFFCFLTISTIFLAHFGHRLHIYILSIILNPVFPLAITILPVLFLFFLRTNTIQDKTLPRYTYLYFLPCIVVFLIWNYMFLIRTNPEVLKPFFFDIIFLQRSHIPSSLKPVYSAHEAAIIQFGIELAAVVVVPILFIPKLIQTSIHRHSEDWKPLVFKFGIQLSVISVLCIGTIVYLVTMSHIKPGWILTMFEFFWGTGVFIAGFLIYRDLSFNNKCISPAPAEGDTFYELEARLRSYFEIPQPYLQPNLKITDIASALNTNRTYVWKLIHMHLNTNFNDFVNKYRIQEVLRLLAEEEPCPKINEIALRAGFNSYTPFYNAFCKEKGISPNSYIKKLKENRLNKNMP